MTDDFSCNACGGDPCTCRPDPVNHPAHYTTHPSGVECIQIAEHMNFCRGNALKYLFRAGVKEKGRELEDLKKARWYLDREIDRLAYAGTLAAPSPLSREGSEAADRALDASRRSRELTERVRVVAYLRIHENQWMSVRNAADALERGDHAKGGG